MPLACPLAPETCGRRAEARPGGCLPRHSPARALAFALAVLCMAAGAPGLAGQASSNVSVEVDLQRPGSATACKVSRAREVQVSCASDAAQLLDGLPERQAFVPSEHGSFGCVPWCGAPGDESRASWRFEYLIGEYSTRTVIFGSREFLEMTISW